MEILYLTKYTRMAGSSRMRSYQYFPYLEREGIKISVKPFFDDDYLVDFYAGKKNVNSVIKSYLRRLFVLLSVFKYDKVVIEKEIFPFLPAVAERMLKLFGISYIVDYDDAIFHNYDQSSNPFIKKLLRDKIANVMRFSGTVVAGNQYLADYASNSGAKDIKIIPTVIDLNRYPVKEKSNCEKFVIGWIGTKTTFEKHLLPCKDWIIDLQNQDSGIQFNIVGITDDMNLGQNVRYIQWTEHTEVSEILKMDVGIMPLQDSKWERGKCAYKLIQYAACGIPGVASDVGMNKEVCVDNITGKIAFTNQDWKDYILLLKNHSVQRKEMGNKARQLVEEKYCIQVTADKWYKILSK